MKIVLNKSYGGFNLSDFAKRKLSLANEEYGDSIFRFYKELIDLIETYGSERISGNNSCLKIIEIPDAFTDFTIEDNDGMESIIYVVDGKLNFN